MARYVKLTEVESKNHVYSDPDKVESVKMGEADETSIVTFVSGDVVVVEGWPNAVARLFAEVSDED